MAFKLGLIGDDELKKQVENYDRLKVTQSYRGCGALLLVFSMAVSVVLVALSFVPVDYLYGLVIYAPLAFFVYKGHSWALVAAMILWTFEKGYQIVTTQSGAVIIFVWWITYMKYFYGAWAIERARKKLAAVPVEENKEAA